MGQAQFARRPVHHRPAVQGLAGRGQHRPRRARDLLPAAGRSRNVGQHPGQENHWTLSRARPDRLLRQRQPAAVGPGQGVHQLGRLDAAQFRWARRGAGADQERDRASPDPRRDHGGQSARFAAKLEPGAGRPVCEGWRRGRRIFCAHLFHDQSEPLRARQGLAARPAAAGCALRSRASMPDRHAAQPLGRIGVVDVGSNSLRLVVFERLGASLLPLLNEKVMCALGRGIARTGRLNPDGVELAFANLQRFVALARALKVDHLTIIATAAVREASDGEAFATAAERQCGIPVHIIAGSEEARLSAAGVLAGIREADGVVGDLGGGSVELVRVDSGAREPIGSGVSLPLGPLRLAELDDNRKAVAETIERGIASAPVLREAAGKTLYLVGGAWRAIARLHMEQTHYPLHIIHEYTIARRPAEGFLEMMAGQSRRSLERIASINRRRLEVVPVAAAILRQLIAAGRPERIVFSAFGLREGYAYGLLPREPRIDPLIAAAMGIAAAGQSGGRNDGKRLQRWTAPLFP